ncbi:MAG: hypothetical protein AAF570_12710, partial [Bacteroidota bacterium]
LQGRESSLPVSLSYHAGGVRVNSQASRVGLSWSLQAGGAISRTIRGLPDEASNGWLNVASQLPNIPANQTWPVPVAQYNAMRPFAKGLKDAQPDAFSVNMPGFSGQIVFDKTGTPHPIPYTKLDLQIDWQAKVWTIRTVDGFTYTFGGTNGVELTFTTSNCDNEISATSPSSWFLKRIESPNGDIIDLNYETAGMFNYPLPISQTAYAKVLNPGNPQAGCGAKPTSTCTGTSFITEIRLKEIVSSTGKLEFSYDPVARLDITGSHALQEIRLFSTSGSLKKRFVLDHFYFSNRLMLESVQEIGDVNTRKPPYTFEYVQTPLLPAVNSFNQDHWGFSNGANNSTLIPKIDHPNCLPLGSADRRPNFVYGQSGLLTKINHPGGAFTRFDYEAHDRTPVSGLADPIDLTANITRTCTTNACAGTNTTSFVNPKSQCVDFSALLQNNVLPECNAEAFLRNVNGQVIASISCNLNGQWQTQAVRLGPGTYFVDAVTGTNGDQAIAKVIFEGEDPQSDGIEEIGGARIKRITDHDGVDPSNDMVREYTYRFAAQPGNSSGMLAREPYYDFEFHETINDVLGPPVLPFITELDLVTCEYLAAQSSIVGGAGTTQGSHIGYAEVKESRGLNDANGYTISEFTSALNYPDEGYDIFPYGPVSTQDHRRGLLTANRVFDANGKKVNESLHSYKFRTENKHTIQGIAAGIDITDPTLVGPETERVIFRAYDIVSEWLHEETSTSRTYHENGVDYVESITTSSYDNPVHSQMTASTMTDSKGRQLKTRMKYPA